MLWNFDLSSLEIDGEDELEQMALTKTKEQVAKLEKIFSKDIVNAIFSDVEEWIKERSSNVRESYFNEITNFLLGKKNCYISESGREDLETRLTGLGYDAEQFRKKIFSENKDALIKAITSDVIYEQLDNYYGNPYFRHWDFSDIKTSYPQSKIASGFLRMLMSKKNFDVTVQSMLSKEIKDRQDELYNLEQKLDDIRRQIGNISGDY